MDSSNRMMMDSESTAQNDAVKVMLIDPPFYKILGFYNRYFPFAIASIGTFLRRQGLNVLVYDADRLVEMKKTNHTRLSDAYEDYLRCLNDPNDPVWQEVSQTISQFDPDLVGISIWTTYAASAFKVAQLCKKAAPSIKVVMGGPHANAKDDEILKICPDVDFVIRGPGEKPLLELARALRSPNQAHTAIPGLSFRSNSQIQRNAISSNDVNNNTYPDRSILLNENQYNSEDMGLIMSSTGCPFDCSYCATHTRHVDYRPIENVIGEIEEVKEKYHTIHFTIKDDSFTVNKKRVAGFCQSLMDRNLKISWDCNTRVGLVNQPLLLMMKRAGCNGIKVGIESGSERILRLMNKQITLEQIRQTARLFRETKIYWTGYFMIGVPSQTPDEMLKTLNFMRQIRPDFASISIYEPFPGTDMFQLGLEKGLTKPDMRLNEYFTLPPHHYYKKDPQQQVDTMTASEFQKLAQYIKSEFHIYNRNHWRLLKRARSRIAIYRHKPNVICRDLKMYLSWR